MPRSVVFDTPGVMDLRAITSIGVNTKPNSTNPIGTFGTGLKYSVAVLVRMGLPIVLVTDGEVYAFYRKTERFRDKDFDFVRMKRQALNSARTRIQYSELSYTTEYGKFWKLWQVFRELYSNTLDENGQTYVVESLDQLEYAEGRTYIVVTGEEFAKEYDNRHENFLPDGLTVRQQDMDLQVLDRPSKHVYYRGMRVYDLEKPALMTYNFLDGVDLTEDRTAKNFWSLKSRIERHVLESGDTEFVQRVVAAEGGTMEAELSYQYHSTEPSEAFTSAARNANGGNATAAAYVRSRALRAPSRNPLAGRPRPWAIRNGYVLDAENDPVLKIDLAGGLAPAEQRYVLALLQKDLEGWELDEFHESEIGLPGAQIP